MIRSLLLACALVSFASAAELVVRDVRLGISTRPSDFDFTVTTPLVDISGKDAFDGGSSIEGGIRWSFARTGDSLGLVAGADLAIDGQSYGGGDGLATMWGKASLGLGWAVSDRITVVGEGLVGYGVSKLDLPATRTAAELSADGSSVSYDARLTGTWQFTRSFNAGLMAGWVVASHDLGDGDVDLTLDQSGWYAGLVFAWRLSDTPASLE